MHTFKQQGELSFRIKKKNMEHVSVFQDKRWLYTNGVILLFFSGFLPLLREDIFRREGIEV